MSAESERSSLLDQFAIIIAKQQALQAAFVYTIAALSNQKHDLFSSLFDDHVEMNQQRRRRGYQVRGKIGYHRWDKNELVQKAQIVSGWMTSETFKELAADRVDATGFAGTVEVPPANSEFYKVLQILLNLVEKNDFSVVAVLEVLAQGPSLSSADEAEYRPRGISTNMRMGAPTGNSPNK